LWYNIYIDVKETACARMAWLQLAHDTVKYATVMDFQVLLEKKQGFY
jgi:hypothetical protein